MRRTLLALAVAAGLSTLAPAPASANHACAPGFEILCVNYCIKKPNELCLH